jgi:hypothetical protein
VRDLSEEICLPMRRAIRSAPRATSAPRVVPAALIVRRGAGQLSAAPTPWGQTPGWAEDAFNGAAGLVVGTTLTYVDEAITAEGGSTAWGAFGGVTSVIGMVLSIVKFVANYACLETEWTVENPPLVRTKSTRIDAETRNVKCRIRWNVPALMEKVKQWRTELNRSTGNLVDFDMPKSDVLANATVEWTLREGEDDPMESAKNPERWCVRWGDGINPLDRRTDADGMTSITLTGLHQRQAVDSKTAEPYMRKVMVTVYPALKSNQDAEQTGTDLLVNVGSVALIEAGAPPIALINVAMETIFRAHWLPAGSKWIQVRDWVVPGSFTAALSVDVTGGGTVTIVDKPDAKDVKRWYIHHHLESVDLQLRLAATAPAQGKRTYRSTQDDYVHFVNDNERDDSWSRDCVTDRTWSKATMTWDEATRDKWKAGGPAGATRPASPFADLLPRLTVDPASGAFVAEVLAVPLLVWVTTKNSEGNEKAGWLTIPLAPGTAEPSQGESEDAPLKVSGVLPERIRKVVADSSQAKEGEEYLFNVERTTTRWREFDTSGGTVRLPLKMKILWKFEYHPPVVQTTK